MAQSKIHTQWPAHETCRSPVKYRRHVIVSRPVGAYLFEFNATKLSFLHFKFCLSGRADTHTENMKEDRSLSPLLCSEDVFREITDSWRRDGQTGTYRMYEIRGIPELQLKR